MKYLIKETVHHYHEVELNEELDIEEIIKTADRNKGRHESGCESIESALRRYFKSHGFEFKVIPNKYGTECVSIDVVDEVD